MKRMLNEASAFREEMIAGYTRAYGRYLRRMPGTSGVMANDVPSPGRVSVVVGGGSGHYPAFYGLVGQGLASAAAIGDIFTSPSGEQCYRVAKAVDGSAGILFSFGNYSGDVMNFGMAEARLRAEGVDARTVLVTDDVLSASREEADQRRGIAGGFFVFKSAGASSARGDRLDDVEALTRHANSRVRTAGIGFAGCTVPGQEQPLFSVAPGQMEIGLGIHGEPGVRVAEQMPSREIAAMLVETLLAETPEGAGSDVAVLVNGLGGTKYEEMFVFYNDVAALLDRSGLAPYNPLIGEFVTSLDMTGMSLSLFWLDDDLKSLLDATFHGGGHHLRGGQHPRRPIRPASARRTATGVGDNRGDGKRVGASRCRRGGRGPRRGHGARVACRGQSDRWLRRDCPADTQARWRCFPERGRGRLGCAGRGLADRHRDGTARPRRGG
jgi:dihydroxyacetone kinase